MHPDPQHKKTQSLSTKNACILKDDVSLVSFQPGSHQISVACAERAACGSTGWFYKGLEDWQVYSPLNVKGLSLSAAPEPPAASVCRQANFVKPE